RLRADLVKLDDVTIYTFPMAFLAADSESKARKALCAADKARAWNELLPKYLDNLVAAAGGAGARLVVLDNLYMLGAGGGTPLNEDTPMNPRSRKGEIRARLARSLVEAHRRGDVRAVTGRASDFYGPGGVGTHFTDRFWKQVFAGKPAEILPNPDTPHTYHYIPDVAEGLKRLGAAPDDALGRAWMLPCAPAESTRALVARFAAAIGREIHVRRMPRIAVKLLGVFMPILREVDEMLHQWDAPFVVDDTRFREAFGMRGTDRDAGAAAMVEWARTTYGSGRGGAAK
ncbi:NAD-dependent epimerase/dehydratase family protein, partial [bacterium]|nr:NAD-dependent epimerase/dehydratase family protein [bacterium]